MHGNNTERRAFTTGFYVLGNRFSNNLLVLVIVLVLVCVIQLTPQWGFSVADYIKCYAYFKPKLAIFTTIEIYFPPCQLPCGRKPERPEKTHDFRQTDSFHMSGALGSSNIEKVLSENLTRSLSGERRAL